LLDLGLVPNTSIEVVELAPNSGPLELSVRGSMLAISKEIASQIFVDLAAEGS
jgi:DtxR family Mn-dependent transcriptional regulator